MSFISNILGWALVFELAAALTGISGTSGIF